MAQDGTNRLDGAQDKMQTYFEWWTKKSLIEIIRSRLINWLDHIMRGDSLLRTIIEGRIEGKRKRGKPRMMLLAFNAFVFRHNTATLFCHLATKICWLFHSNLDDKRGLQQVEREIWTSWWIWPFYDRTYLGNQRTKKNKTSIRRPTCTCKDRRTM